MKRKRKALTLFKPQIRSRHPSHKVLREKGSLVLLPFRSVVRFGSTTELPDTVAKGGKRVELNKIEAVQASSNKRLMKRAFREAGVKTPMWFEVNPSLMTFVNQTTKGTIESEDLPFPIIAKQIFGSRGRGNHKLDTVEELNEFLKRDRKSLRNYIFEVFINYAREYRLHVTKDGCFYTNRKMLKEETENDKRWYRNDSNCSWFLETNPKFDRPKSWDDIVEHSIGALNAIGLDFGAVDVKVQSKDAQDFTIIEINSAPSFGNTTTLKYQEIIPKLLKEKRTLI